MVTQSAYLINSKMVDQCLIDVIPEHHQRTTVTNEKISIVLWLLFDRLHRARIEFAFSVDRGKNRLLFDGITIQGEFFCIQQADVTIFGPNEELLAIGAQ